MTFAQTNNPCGCLGKVNFVLIFVLFILLFASLTCTEIAFIYLKLFSTSACSNRPASFFWWIFLYGPYGPLCTTPVLFHCFVLMYADVLLILCICIFVMCTSCIVSWFWCLLMSSWFRILTKLANRLQEMEMLKKPRRWRNEEYTCSICSWGWSRRRLLSRAALEWRVCFVG